MELKIKPKEGINQGMDEGSHSNGMEWNGMEWNGMEMEWME